MAIVYEHNFTGAASTNGSAASPTTGSALVVDLGGSPEATLDGAGKLQGSSADTWYQVNGSMGDSTYKMTFTPAQQFTGEITFFFHTASPTGFWNGDGCALQLQGNGFGAGVDLQDRGASNSIDSVLATYSAGITANVETSLWMRLDGNRCRVWLGANTGTPDIDYTGLPRTSGSCGFKISSTSAFINSITIDDVASSPTAPPRQDFQNPLRILKRMTRSRLFKAA